MLLLLGLIVVAALLVTVVVDASTLFLQRRALSAAADGTALAAAQAVDGEAVYSGGTSGTVPLDPARVDDVAGEYVRLADLGARFDRFRVEQVSSDGRSVTVRLSARVVLPFANLVTGDDSGVEMQAEARAQTRVGD